MKENKAANSNKNINNTVNTVRNSDIIKLDKKDTTMNNIDLNTVTVAEAKAAGITGMDLLTVLRNPVNTVQTKKNEEFAAELNARTTKVRTIKTSKRRANVAGLTKRLSWQSKDTDGVTNLTKFFNGMSELLGSDFANWKHDADFDDAIVTVVEDIFGSLDLDDHGKLNIIQKGSVWISNLNLALRYAKADNDTTKDILTGYFWHAYKHPVTSAMEAGLIGSGEGQAVVKYLEGLK